MGLINTLRKAEERSREAARRGLERARSSWEDTERALRRKMRVNREADISSRSVERRPIISINGRDVHPSEIGRKKIA